MNIFVPARKGSSRVYRKNTRIVNGEPLIWWTFSAIEKLCELRPDISFETFVSTDDPLIADMAINFGYRLLIRPPELATSETTMSAVLFQSNRFLNDGDDVMVLYPTSPLRKAHHIAEALALWQLKGSREKSLMSVSPVNHRPFGLMSIAESGELRCNHVEGQLYYQAQHMPIRYRANGAIYIIPKTLIDNARINTQLFTEHTIPYVMNEYDSLEIDNEDDIPMAEALMRKKITELEPAVPISSGQNGVSAGAS